MFSSCGAALKPPWSPAAGSFGQGPLFSYPNFFFLDHPHPFLKSCVRYWVLIKSIQIRKAYKMCFFINKNTVKAKVSEAPPGSNWGSFHRSSKSPSWCNWV